METTDKQFFLTFLGVSAALLAIAVIILIAANWVGSAATDGTRVSQARLDLIRARIEPVGEVNLESDPVASVDSPLVKVPGAAPAEQPGSAPEAAEAPTTAQVSGEEVYASVCQSCHATGVGGAPVVGDASVWSERLAAGMEVMYKSALEGKGIMPAKGGNPALSDAQVKAAVDYMIDQSR